MFHSPFKGLVAFVVLWLSWQDQTWSRMFPTSNCILDGILHTTRKRKLLLVFYVVLGA